MGMAASQARFLALTARKTNVEYEGQQVNQQRTALSNQSAGLYNQMLSLTVPTPPSATDYYAMRYSYTEGALDFEITRYVPNSDGTYRVTVRTAEDVEEFQKVTLNSNLKSQIAHILHVEEKDNGAREYYITYGSTSEKHTLTAPTVNPNISALDPELKEDTLFYSYGRDDTTYFIPQGTVVNNAVKDGWAGEFEAYKALKSKNVKETTYENAHLIADSTGKYSYITLPDGHQYKLTLDEVSDDTGYDEAMQKYNYEKMIYEKTISDINAKTEKLQAEDRTLELRLKQLDTEQNALKTEMDAVKSVIKDNVEKTFNTFG